MKKLLALILFIFPFAAGAQEISDSLIGLLRESMSDTQRVNHLNAIARQLDNERSPEVKTYASQALSLAKKSNYIAGQATAYLMLGFAEEAQSHFAAAINYYEKSHQTAVQMGDTLAQAKALGPG